MSLSAIVQNLMRKGAISLALLFPTSGDAHPLVALSPPTAAEHSYCAMDTVRGNLPGVIHVVYHAHADPLTREIFDEAVLSQVHVFRTFQQLLGRESIDYALIEGYPKGTNIEQHLRATALERGHNPQEIATGYAELVARTQTAMRKAGRKHQRETAQDYVAGHYVFYGTQMLYALLTHTNPAVQFTGFEDGTNEVVIDYLEKYHTRKPAVDGRPLTAAGMGMILREYGLKHRSRLAVDHAISMNKDGKNGVIVIGERHDRSVREYLTSLPAAERPTVIFHKNDCDGEPYLTRDDIHQIRQNQEDALYQCLAKPTVSSSPSSIDTCLELQQGLGIKNIDEQRLMEAMLKELKGVLF